MTRHQLNIYAVLFAACLAQAAHATGTSPADNSHQQKHKHKIRMDEPMTTRMMREGMMKGDVERDADKKAEKMQPMIEQEQKSMPQDKAKP